MAPKPTIQPWQVNLEGKVHPAAMNAIKLMFDAFQDHDTAIVELNKKVVAMKPGTAIAGAAAAFVAPAADDDPNPYPYLGLVNKQIGAASYLTATSDQGGLIVVSNAAGVAVSLSAAVTAPWFAGVLNRGTGVATLTPSMGTINGGSSVTVPTGTGAVVYFDGVNFWAIAPSSGVTNVGLTVPSRMTVAGSPVTSSGTFAVTDNVQAANVVFAGPASGASAVPGFRAVVAADLPLATTAAVGVVKADGTTITITGGILSGSSSVPGLMLSGTVDPTNSVTGSDGQFYVNTTAKTIWGPRASGVWTKIGTLT